MLLIGFSYFSQRFALYTFCLIYVVYFLNESFWTEAALYFFKTFALDYVNIPKQNQTIDYRLHTNIKKNMFQHNLNTKRLSHHNHVWEVRKEGNESKQNNGMFVWQVKLKISLDQMLNKTFCTSFVYLSISTAQHQKYM